MNPDPAIAIEAAQALFDRAKAGDVGAVSQAMSSLETDDSLAVSLSLFSWRNRRSGTVGFTGPPGAGKSSLVSAVVRELRARGATVAVLAVDPSSPISGGAILGDRFRMREHTLDPGVYIRSMASRGASGGLARATADCAAFLSGLYDWVLLESVGIGQSDVDIHTTTDTTVLVLLPGAGDVVQSLKAGVLEIADVFVVNKADCGGAAALQADIESMLASAHARGARSPPVLATAATRGVGVDALVDALCERRSLIEQPQMRDRHRRTQLTSASAAIAADALRSALSGLAASAEWERVAAGLTSPREGASELLRRLMASGATQ